MYEEKEKLEKLLIDAQNKLEISENNKQNLISAGHETEKLLNSMKLKLHESNSQVQNIFYEINDCMVSNKDLLECVSSQFNNHLSKPEINDGHFNLDSLICIKDLSIIKYEDLNQRHFRQLINGDYNLIIGGENAGLEDIDSNGYVNAKN